MLKILNFEKAGPPFPRCRRPYLETIRYTTKITAAKVPIKMKEPKFVTIQLNTLFVNSVVLVGLMTTRSAIAVTTSVLISVNGTLILDDFMRAFLPFYFAVILILQRSSPFALHACNSH